MQRKQCAPVTSESRSVCMFRNLQKHKWGGGGVVRNYILTICG